MRRLLLAAVLALSPALAMADQTVAGQWEASPGHGVLVVMDILADGHWSSQTVQDERVVAEMAGTYDQARTGDAAGRLVFRPLTSGTSAGHGAAEVEEDEYTLAGNGKVLRLVGGGETTEFHRQPLADK